MKTFVAVLAITATCSLAHADDDGGMAVLQLMMRFPAISADAKHVAIFSDDGGADKKANTSVVVFGIGGKLEQRISIVPPAAGAAKAKAAVDKIVKLLDAGGYQRMSRIAQVSDSTDKTSFTLQLSSEDVVLDIQLANRTLTLSPTRAGKPLAKITRKLPAKDGRCKRADSYSLSNTMAGFDVTTGVFAFTIDAFQKDTGCAAHEFLVTLK